MSSRTLTLIFATALVGCPRGMATDTVGADQQTFVDQSHSAGDTDRLLAEGKEIFIEKCARCHSERGDKPLKTGAPLNERGLSSDVIAQVVNGRLRDRTEDERRAVTLYIASFMQNKDSGKK